MLRKNNNLLFGGTEPKTSRRYPLGAQGYQKEEKMLRSILISLIIIGVIIAVPKSTTPAEADNLGVVKVETEGVPQKMNLQGYLTDANGNPINGQLSMTFKIYHGGTLMWSEDQTVNVQAGLFNATLGIINPIPWSIFEPGTTCEFELVVQGQSFPRIEITSVGFAFKSVKSDTASYALNASISRPITPPIGTNEIADRAVTEPKLADNAVSTRTIQDGAVTGSKTNSEIFLTSGSRPMSGPLNMQNN